jgi:hypothetical protein
MTAYTGGVCGDCKTVSTFLPMSASTAANAATV